MSGVYGGSLWAFPELFQSVEYWEATQEPGGGWNPQPPQVGPMVWLPKQASGYTKKSVADWMSQDIQNNDILHTEEEVPLNIGMFLRHPQSKEIFRVVTQLDYAYVDGFNVWGISKVQGSTGFNQEPVVISGGRY